MEVVVWLHTLSLLYITYYLDDTNLKSKANKYHVMLLYQTS